MKHSSVSLPAAPVSVSSESKGQIWDLLLAQSHFTCDFSHLMRSLISACHLAGKPNIQMCKVPLKILGGNTLILFPSTTSDNYMNLDTKLECPPLTRAAMIQFHWGSLGSES